jgi:S1-C subfamily serine protease
MIAIFPKLLLILPLSLLIMLGLQRNNIYQYNKLEQHVKHVGENLSSTPKYHRNQQPNLEKLKQIAQSTTVKIFAEDENNSRGGSGVIISESDDNYFVITNNHVVDDVNIKYKLQTYEGQIYSAEVIEQNNSDLNVDDLALLKFKADKKYAVVKIKLNLSNYENTKVFASGFPFEENLQQSPKIKYTLGNVKQILPHPLMGGYQIGYTNNVHNGMSGGSIINAEGQLIGINGLGKDPLFGNPYVFQNGQDTLEGQFEQMSQLSWGITSNSIVNFVEQIKASKKINFRLKIVQ